MKKNISFASLLLVLIVALAMFGCSNANAQNSTTNKALANSNAAVPSVASQLQNNSDLSSKDTKTLTGIIDDTAMQQMWLELENGDIIDFVYGDADVENLTDAMPGTQVIVHYTGVLNGTDTSDMTIIKIENAMA